MTVGEYEKLVETGVLDTVELIDGRVVMGGYELVFSPQQAVAAARLGIPVRTCIDAVLADPDSRAQMAARLCS